MPYVSLNLKVCEGCGVLWLRRSEDRQPYCLSCKEMLRNFPAKKARPAARPRRCKVHSFSLVKRGIEANA
jgi:hypothetical protein